MLTLFRKELSSFLFSLIGFIVITVFLLVIGLYLWVFPVDLNILDYGYANINGLFIMAPWVFLFLIPAITMRSFAEERRSGTIELLLTRPLTDLQIVMAKFLAGLSLVAIALLPTLVFYISVYQLGLPKGNIDTGGMWGSYIGLLFLGGAFVAIGLFCSSLTDNQIISFILGLAICFAVFIVDKILFMVPAFLTSTLEFLSLDYHFGNIARGVIDTRDLLFYATFIGGFLMFSVYSLQSERLK